MTERRGGGRKASQFGGRSTSRALGGLEEQLGEWEAGAGPWQLGRGADRKGQRRGVPGNMALVRGEVAGASGRRVSPWRQEGL